MPTHKWLTLSPHPLTSEEGRFPPTSFWNRLGRYHGRSGTGHRLSTWVLWRCPVTLSPKSSRHCFNYAQSTSGKIGSAISFSATDLSSSSGWTNCQDTWARDYQFGFEFRSDFVSFGGIDKKLTKNGLLQGVRWGCDPQLNNQNSSDRGQPRKMRCSTSSGSVPKRKFNEFCVLQLLLGKTNKMFSKPRLRKTVFWSLCGVSYIGPAPSQTGPKRYEGGSVAQVKASKAGNKTRAKPQTCPESAMAIFASPAAMTTAQSNNRLEAPALLCLLVLHREGRGCGPVKVPFAVLAFSNVLQAFVPHARPIRMIRATFVFWVSPMFCMYFG